MTGFLFSGGAGSHTIQAKNVKDYGAVGDGVTNDRAAIQAAVDDTGAPYSVANRGIIFFPVGTYLLSSSVTFELSDGITSIAFIGAPGATITGGFADALLKRSVNSPNGGVYLIENLILNNSNVAGKCIMLHSTVGSKIVGCSITGVIGVETYNSESVTVDSCSLLSAVGGTGIGIVAGNATTVLNCDFTHFGEGIRHSNAGLVVLGGRIETCTIGINLGVDPAGAGNQSTGVTISGISTESNITFLHVVAAAGLDVSAIGISAAQTGIAYGINVLGGDHMSFRALTVSSAHGWSVAAISLTGGDHITMNSVTGSGSANWNVAANVDVEFTNCDAPMPTFANLPSASAVAINARRYISDADANFSTYTHVAAGGSTNKAPIYTDGTNWRYG